MFHVTWRRANARQSHSSMLVQPLWSIIVYRNSSIHKISIGMTTINRQLLVFVCMCFDTFVCEWVLCVCVCVCVCA